jgi:hypothetical protein
VICFDLWDYGSLSHSTLEILRSLISVGMYPLVTNDLDLLQLSLTTNF